MKFRTTAIIGGSILGLVMAYVGYILSSTGYFREITNVARVKVLRKVEIPGAEDITISPNGQFAIISSDDRAARRDQRAYRNGIYFLDLNNLSADPKLISQNLDLELNPHGISLYQLDASTYRLLVINHVQGDHTIEDLRLVGDSLFHWRTIQDPTMISPNDVVLIDDERYYFTNDHGYTSKIGVLAENYLGLAVSNVVCYDGEQFQEAAGGIAYANGINYDPLTKLLYVASPRGFEIITYQVNNDLSLTHIRDIPVGTGIDNLELDEQGSLWTGAHPNLLRFTAYAAGKVTTAPSEVLQVNVNEADGIEQWLLDDGELISGASVAAKRDKILLIGNVMDNTFLITELQ